MSKVHLVTGGCGFVGRNLTRWLLKNTHDNIIIIDDLSIGKPIEEWLENLEQSKDRIHVIYKDVCKCFHEELSDSSFISKVFPGVNKFSDVFHFAAIVGGRMIIENDPIKVALDLSIDAEFFQWVTKHRPERVLYPSSSAAYPIKLQSGKNSSRALKETDIDLENIAMPDLTYGWVKVTGELLSQITARKYNIHLTCIRPFSGYGEDQDLTYPIPAIAKRFAHKEDPLEVWGDGEQIRDFIHINDLIEGFLKAMDHISDGSAINLGNGVPTSFNEVIKLLSEISGHHPAVSHLRQKPVGVMCRYADTEKSKSNLDWTPKTNLKEGLKKVYQYQLRNR